MMVNPRVIWLQKTIAVFNGVEMFFCFPGNS